MTMGLRRYQRLLWRNRLVLWLAFALIVSGVFLFNYTYVQTSSRESQTMMHRAFSKRPNNQATFLPNFQPPESEHVTKRRGISLDDIFQKKLNFNENGKSSIWPSKQFHQNDRILEQIHFKPKWLIEAERTKTDIPLKTIMLYFGKEIWEVKEGQGTFIDQECEVDKCRLTWDRNELSTADAVLFRNMPVYERQNVSQSQIWILFLLESPFNTRTLRGSDDVFNWTATYRHDSDIVTPYDKFKLHDDTIKSIPQNKNYATGKSKMVAWFVSQCNPRNSRMKYAKELAKHIKVDIYGKCGTLQCQRGTTQCSELLDKDYKFYLAFENSNCRDYITEKFFELGLKHDVLPIVMGAAPEDYARAAPPHSYIHVDEFESPQQLAQYLHKLATNDDLYNSYFQWKGAGRFINTYFWCRVCAMLHETPPGQRPRDKRVSADLERWWRGNSVCIGKKDWREVPRSEYIIDMW